MPAPTVHVACYYWSRWASWRDHLNYTTFHHGAAMVEMLGTPHGGRPGLPDNVCVAESILELLESAGLIVRAKYAPTPNQRFMGVNGGWTDELMSRSRVTYGWSRGPLLITPATLGMESGE